MATLVLKEAEVRLVEKINAIQPDSMNWRAMHFRFGELNEQYRSEYQKKITLNVVVDHLKLDEGAIFVCLDFDLFVLCRSVPKQSLDKLIFQLRYLVSDDPLAYSVEGVENPEFALVYDLSVAWESFYELAKRRLVQSARKDADASPASSSGRGARSYVDPTSKRALRPMTPLRLAEAERELAIADLGQVLRRQPVCALVKGKSNKRIFDEFYINIAHLQQQVMADVQLTSNPWLFRYLTQVLDMRMLELLARRPSVYFESSASINLNVESVLSEKFLEFDLAVKPVIRVPLIIEFQIADVFSNMERFLRARETLQRMGYRVCLDGLTLFSFPQVDRERLGFDIAKLQWNAELEAEASSPENRPIGKAIEAYGPNRVILCRCDTRDAVEFGRALGISLFQGRYVDFLLNPNMKSRN